MRRVLPILAAAAMGVAAVRPARAQQAAPPTCDTPEYRQFDFWLGAWDVVDATDDQPAGRNRIERILGGCVLHEMWTSTDGSQGQSFSIYDRSAHQWHQTWVDEHGLLLQLDGGLEGQAMVLEGERLSPEGARVRHRVTWTPLDARRVRQHWERSRDGGQTWENVFDGIYTRASGR